MILVVAAALLFLQGISQNKDLKYFLDCSLKCTFWLCSPFLGLATNLVLQVFGDSLMPSLLGLDQITSESHEKVLFGSRAH